MKEYLHNIWEGFFPKQHFIGRLIAVIIAVIIMGFSLSWLLLVDMGTDPCTLMNNAIAHKIGISLGNWQASFNTVLLIVVLIFGERNLGFGTLANMFLVGYSIDFFSWVWRQVLPPDLFQSMTVRILVLLPALIIFILAAAVYMDMELGTSPYDAIPFILSKKISRVPFKVVRICYDVVVVIIALLFGGKLGIVTVVMAFALGPVIAWVGTRIKKIVKF